MTGDMFSNLDFLSKTTRETVEEHLRTLEALSKETPINKERVLAVHSKITDLLVPVKTSHWTPAMPETNPAQATLAAQVLEKYNQALYRLLNIEDSFVHDCEILPKEPVEDKAAPDQNIIRKEQVRPKLAACLDKLRTDCPKVLAGNILQDHERLLFLLKQTRCYHDILFRREAFAKRSKVVQLPVTFDPQDTADSMTQTITGTNIETLPSQQFALDIEKTCLLVEGLVIIHTPPHTDTNTE